MAIIVPSNKVKQGCTVDHEYLGRRMKVYPIQESELKHISGLNHIATVAFSLGAAFFGYALAIILEDVFNVTATPEAKVLVFYAPKLLGILGFAAWVLGGIAIRTRGSILRTIREESYSETSE